MPGDRRVALRTLNCHLTCALCSGYMIDASTICACRHTFCRSCLFRYLKRYRRCPICDIKVKRNPGSKPNIRYDNTIQELIFKVVPGLVEKEMILRENFYNKSSDKCKGCNIEKEDDISICLMQCERDNLKNQSSAPKKYLLSPSAFSVRMMKKFIRYKFNVKDKFQISLYSGTMLPLNDTQSMRDVAFDSRWMRTAPLEIRFSLAVPSECVDVIGTRSKHPRINTGLRCSSGKGRSLCGSTWLDGERADCGGRVDVDEGEWLGESSPAATTTGYHSESEPASTFRSAMDPHVAWSHGYDLSPAHRDGHAHPAISDTNPRQRPPLLTPKSEPLYTGYPGCNDNSVNNRQGEDQLSTAMEWDAAVELRRRGSKRSCKRRRGMTSIAGVKRNTARCRITGEMRSRRRTIDDGEEGEEEEDGEDEEGSNDFTQMVLGDICEGGEGGRRLGVVTAPANQVRFR